MRREDDDCFSVVEPLKSPPILKNDKYLHQDDHFYLKHPIDYISASSTDIFRGVNHEERNVIIVDEFAINTLYSQNLNKCVDSILRNEDSAKMMVNKLEKLYPHK